MNSGGTHFEVTSASGEITIKFMIFLSEKRRQFFSSDGTETGVYSYDRFYDEGFNWCEGNAFSSRYNLYPCNLHSAFAHIPEARYVPMSRFIRIIGGAYPKNIIRWLKEYPCIEYLVKLGMTNLIGDILEDNGYTENDAELLKGNFKDAFAGISISDAVKININTNGMRIYRFLSEKYKSVLIDFVKWVQDTGTRAECVTAGLKYLSPQKYMNYIIKQAERNASDNVTVSNLIGDYADYITDGEELGYDFSESIITRPRDLLTAHGVASAYIDLMHDAEKYKALEERFAQRKEELSALCFEMDGLFIRPPQSPLELLAEGKTLSHCVGRYCKKHADAVSSIMFVRRTSEPEAPFYTCEFAGSDSRAVRILQCRGRNNKGMTEDCEVFIRKWTEYASRILYGKSKNGKTKSA